MIQNLRPLTQEERQAARKIAREAVIRASGAKPIHEHFASETISRYPASVAPYPQKTSSKGKRYSD